MAVVVSFINMKGGVGKTTIAAQLAQYTSSRGIRTLAIDLDPQANLSQVLLGQLEYSQFLKSGRPSIEDVIRGYAPPSGKRKSPSRASVSECIVKPPVWLRSAVEIVPSRLELAGSIKRSAVAPDLLARELAQVDGSYDLIIIDCAPTESILTDAAYRTSGHLVVPVRPEYLATIGLPLLARSLKEFKQNNRRHGLNVAGVVINDVTYKSQKDKIVTQSMIEIAEQSRLNGWSVFENRFPYSRSWTKSARLGMPISHTRHTRKRVVMEFQMFAGEFLNRIGVRIP